MLDPWIGEVVGTLHRYGISKQALAEELGWSRQYLSMVLGGSRRPKEAEQKINAAVQAIINTKNGHAR